MNLSLGLDWLLSQYTLDRRRGNTVSPGDLADALALAAVILDGSIVEFQRSTADTLAFETGAPHAGAHPLDDQASFEFSDRADDDNDGPAQRAAGVDIFSERDELYLQSVQIVENREEMASAPS